MSWESDLLAAMGAPANNVTVTALQLWAQSEGTPDSWNNWLATTLNCCGCSPVNSAGVCAYPTESDGVSATWQTLQGGAYGDVVAAFQAGTSLASIWSAINASPWCSGCQNGDYPIALYDYLQGKTGPPAPGTPVEPTVQLGSHGRAVRLLQRRLDDLGHLLPVDGRFDERTQDAVLDFQGHHGLVRDGIVGPLTWAALLSATGGPQPGPQQSGQGGSIPPNEPPTGIDGRALDAWSLLGDRTGRIADQQLQQMAAVQDIMRGHRR